MGYRHRACRRRAAKPQVLSVETPFAAEAMLQADSKTLYLGAAAAAASDLAVTGIRVEPGLAREPIEAGRINRFVDTSATKSRAHCGRAAAAEVEAPILRAIGRRNRVTDVQAHP